MLESLVIYPIIGFMTTYLALEVAWHFTACKIKDKTIKPSLFKQIGLLTSYYNTIGMLPQSPYYANLSY